MLVSLGFLLAALLGFIVAPAYWARAVRLTTERIRRSLPLTEAEIRADRDKLRAEHAVRVHKLEARADRARLSAARQRVEINRRDAMISRLERDVKELNTNLEASENARRVLEQTIVDRVPKLETQILVSRKLVNERNQDLANLKADTSKTYRALDEAMQINAQQRNEIDRLRSALATRGARSTEGAASPRFDTEVALRSEVEALRARTRDQASLISRLQDIVSARSEEAAEEAEAVRVDAEAAHAAAESGDTPAASSSEATEAVSAAGAADASHQAEVATLKAANRAQAEEIARLKAALKSLEDKSEERSSGLPSAQDNKTAEKTRLNSEEKERLQDTDTIKRLRAELAASNERLAKQAAQFMDEMRRLGAGTVPTTVPSRRNGEANRPPRPSLAQRITEEVPDTAAELSTLGADVPAPRFRNKRPSNGAASEAQAESSPGTGSANATDTTEPRKTRDAESTSEEAASPVKPAGPPSLESATTSPAPRRRASLMDRIASIGKS